METMFTSEGFAIFTTGMLALVFAAAFVLRNWLAGMMTMLSLIVLIFVGLFGAPSELFWLSVVGTVTLLMAGMAARSL